MIELNQTIAFPERSYDLITVGEVLIDMIAGEYEEGQEKKKPVNYQPFFGGSPANIAMNTKKLGIHSMLATAVGKDSFGEFLIEQLEMNKLDTSYVQRVNYATSMVVVTRSTDTPVPIFYRGADCHLDYNEQLDAAISKSKIVHFSCWPISQLPVRKTVEKVLLKARENNSLICFDPNYHPMIWTHDEDGIEYVKSMIAQADIVKPSEDDAARLFGPDSASNQVEKFLSLGAKLVIMTLGKDGALISNGKETLRLASLATEVVDVTGAGDAFWSGFYAGIIKGLTVTEALHVGFAVSAYKLKYVGAVIDLPQLEQIQAMYGLVEEDRG